jgi:hypothetical protein
MRRTTAKTAKDQKTSSRAPAGEERDQVRVSSAHLRAEQEDKGQKTAYRPRYSQQGGDQLSPCLHKAAQWLLATPPKNSVDGAGCQRKTSASSTHFGGPAPLLCEDYVHGRIESTAVLPPWPCVATPSPRRYGEGGPWRYKGGEAAPQRGSDLHLLQAASWARRFFNLWPTRAL